MTSTTDTWAIVELMGHRVRAGRISEIEAYATKLLQVDIPMPDGGFVTEQYGGAAIYSVRPATEEIVRDYASRYGDPRPVSPLAYRLPEPSSATADDDEVNF
jgi:hypothetical protein